MIGDRQVTQPSNIKSFTPSNSWLQPAISFPIVYVTWQRGSHSLDSESNPRKLTKHLSVSHWSMTVFTWSTQPVGLLGYHMWRSGRSKLVCLEVSLLRPSQSSSPRLFNCWWFTSKDWGKTKTARCPIAESSLRLLSTLLDSGHFPFQAMSHIP